MRSVSRFEANLLRILHCLLQRAPRESALLLVLGGQERPPCLGRDAVALVADALGKGCVLLLARDGGCRRERYLRGERAVEGRLWERTPPEELGLAFSGASLSFLIWLTAADFRRGKGPGPCPGRDEERTLGDRLLLFFAYQALRQTEAARALRAQPAFARHALCRLAYPDDFADPAGTADLDWRPWTDAMGCCLLEALQPTLARRWEAIERSKGSITGAARMRALGQAQARVLDSFLDRIDAIGRRDLARFVLVAADVLLGDNPPEQDWVGALDHEGLRLADRAEVHRAALAFLLALDRLRGWDQEARGVGYFDEGYAASQLWKADWERHEGEARRGIARAILRRVEPFMLTTEQGHPGATRP